MQAACHDDVTTVNRWCRMNFYGNKKPQAVAWGLLRVGGPKRILAVGYGGGLRYSVPSDGQDHEAAHNPKKRLTRCAHLVFLVLCSSCRKQACASALRTKKPQAVAWGFLKVGGPKRIRTAVAAFAELSLATRPSDHQNRRARRVGKYTKTNALRLHPTRGKCTFAP